MTGQLNIIFPANALDKLGFTEIVQRLAQLCITESAKELAQQTHPSIDVPYIQKQLRAAYEAKSLIFSGLQTPFFPNGNWKKHLQAASIPGNWLDEEALSSFIQALNSCVAWHKFLQKQVEVSPNLCQNRDVFIIIHKVLADFSDFLDANGCVLPNASPELFRCQQAIYELENTIRLSLQRILKRCIQQGWTEEKSYTIRNERYIIPVLAAHKTHLRGLVHDVSGTGQTFFIEPMEMVDLNNQIKEVTIAYKNEKIRILKQITAEIKKVSAELNAAFEYLTWLDYSCASGRLSIELNAQLPDFQPEKRYFRLINARNPVLVMRGSAGVVPFSATLTEKCSFLMVSGPNAGGKSVTLKTVGLLQAMLQSGLLPTASPDSCFPLFTSFLVDVGDNQSIQQNLSTYSAHLNNLKLFLETGNEASLVLLDELGSGTDPQIGGAIAQAVIEKLLQKKCFGVITTHYNSLKIMGLQDERILSACMDFDVTKLEPTYHLSVGNPGSSFALEIAKRMNFPAQILQRATELSEAKTISLDDHLEDLSRKQIDLDSLIAENQSIKRQLITLADEEKKRLQAIQQSKQAILEEARSQAKELIGEANAKIERVIAEIRKNQAKKEITKNLRQELETLAQEMTTEEPATQYITTQKPVVVGSWVKIRSNNAIGEVVKIQKNKATVETENVQLTVAIQDLVVVEHSDNKKFQLAERPVVNRNYSLELDIRGLRVDAALTELEKYLDSVVQTGLSSVKIIHGKGGGILRNAIREKLSQMSYVKSFSDDLPQYSGIGATLVQLV